MVASASRNSLTRNISRSGSVPNRRTAQGTRWDKKMSNNCAWALLVYTMLQIFVVLGSITTDGMSIAPYFGLLLLVAIIIPFCRKYENRWKDLQDSGLTHDGLALRYRRDQIFLWALAIGLPFIFVAVFKSIAALF